MTTARDARGCALSGATAGASQRYEHALGALLAWRDGAEAAVARALDDAPAFTMAHVLRAYLRLCSRDPQRVRAAGPLLQQGMRLPADGREAAHWGVIRAVLADDYEGARRRLGELLRLHPRDALALHVAQSLDYAMGDVDAMRPRVAAVLPS